MPGHDVARIALCMGIRHSPQVLVRRPKRRAGYRARGHSFERGLSPTTPPLWLNPFGSTLLQFVDSGRLPGSRTLSEPQIGIHDFHSYCSQACEPSIFLRKIINPLGGSHDVHPQPGRRPNQSRASTFSSNRERPCMQREGMHGLLAIRVEGRLHVFPDHVHPPSFTQKGLLCIL